METYYIKYVQLEELREKYFEHVWSNETYKKKVQYLFISINFFLQFPVNKTPNKSDNR